MPASGAPKSAKARNTRVAFSGLTSIHTSRSLVKRGSVYSITAYPPTTRYLAPQRLNALNRSLKLEFGLTPVLPPIGVQDHLPCGGENRRRALALPEFNIERAAAFADFAQTFHHEWRWRICG